MLDNKFIITFILIFTIILSVGAKDTQNLKKLIEKITYSHLKEQYDGNYKKGSWTDVKNSKPAKYEYWSYPTGVSMYAMQRAIDILKNDTIINYVNNYFRITANNYEYFRWQKYAFGTTIKTGYITKLMRLTMLDDCGAMGTALLETVIHHKCEVTPNIQQMIDIFGNYVTNVQARLPDGAFWRPKSEFSPTIWVDDIYMGLPFLVKWAEYTKDNSHLTDAAKQIISYASYLQDDNDGIFYHGYFVEEERRSCCKWGRGNGWAAVGISEVLSALPQSHPNYKQVLKIFTMQMQGLKEYQAEDGLWHQVLDHPELSFGTETSCSAEFTYAIARGINRGWLGKSYTAVVNKAMKGLRGRISESGGINKVCKSTVIEDNLDYYNNRPIKDNDHHGHGLMLLALTEVYRLYENK